MKTLFDYQVICRRDDNGSYVAYVPPLESCHAIGATPEQAEQELHNVFDMIAEEDQTRGACVSRMSSVTMSSMRSSSSVRSAASRRNSVSNSLR